MTAQLAPTPIQKFFDNNGNPLFNGKLYSYVAGTSTPQATYTDSTMGTQNTNPVILNARGEANIWLDTTLSYKLVLQEANGTQIWSVDNIPGNGVFGTVQNIAALRNVTGVGVSNYQAIIVDGYTTAGDGGGGTFWWNSTSTVSDNGGTIIAPTGMSTGRWYRLYSGPLHAAWFGAVGDGTTNDSTAIGNAISVLPVNGGCIVFEDGKTYSCNLTITTNNVRFQSSSSINSFDSTNACSFVPNSSSSYVLTLGNGTTAYNGFTSDGISYFGNDANQYGIHIFGFSNVHFENGYIRGFTTEGVGIDSSSTINTSYVYFNNFSILCASVSNAIGLRATYGNTYVTAIYCTNCSLQATNNSGAHALSINGVIINLVNTYITAFNNAGVYLSAANSKNPILIGYGMIIDGDSASSNVIKFNSIASTGSDDISNYLQGSIIINGKILFNDSVAITPAIGNISPYQSYITDLIAAGVVSFAAGNISQIASQGVAFPKIYSSGVAGNLIVQTTSGLTQFQSGGAFFNNGPIIFTGSPASTSSGQISLGSTTATTATAGSGTLPANPIGFLMISIGGTTYKIPYYAN